MLVYALKKTTVGYIDLYIIRMHTLEVDGSLHGHVGAI